MLPFCGDESARPNEWGTAEEEEKEKEEFRDNVPQWAAMYRSGGTVLRNGNLASRIKVFFRVPSPATLATFLTLVLLFFSSLLEPLSACLVSYNLILPREPHNTLPLYR